MILKESSNVYSMRVIEDAVHTHINIHIHLNAVVDQPHLIWSVQLFNSFGVCIVFFATSCKYMARSVEEIVCLALYPMSV